MDFQPDLTVETLDGGPERLEAAEHGEPIACVMLQQPDVFGRLVDPAPYRAWCDRTGALLVMSVDPVSLGLLQSPGGAGADIVVGDIQPLGNPLSFGGPYGGFMAAKQALVRQLPGRLVGRATDRKGRPCYTLTLQTREQHIRRAKATSNICTNQALNVLRATVYLSLMGPQGLHDVAAISVERAHWLAEQLLVLDGVSLWAPDAPFFSEFVIRLPMPAEDFARQMVAERVLAGLPVTSLGVEQPDLLPGHVGRDALLA